MPLRLRPARAVSVLAALTIVAIVVAVTVLLLDLRAREVTHAHLETVSVARILLEQTEQSFDGTDLVLTGLQERLQTTYGSHFALDSLPIHLLLSARIAGMRQIGALFITDANGVAVNSTRQFPTPPVSVADREYFKAFANGKDTGLFIDKPVRGRSNGLWTLHIARRFTDAGGKFRGVIVAAVNLSYFEQKFEYMKLDFSRPIALYLEDGTLVASLPHRENEIGDRALELGPGKLPAAGAAVSLVTHRSGNGTQQVFALGRVKGLPLLVGVTNDEDEVLATWREIAVPIALGAVLVAIFIAVVATLLARELLREEKLSRALREADDRYQRTIDSVMDAIVAVDEAQNILIFNPAAEKMFGLSMFDAIGRPLSQLIPARQRDAHGQHLRDFMPADVAPRPMAPELEVTGLRADGSEFPIESTISRAVINGKLQMTAVLRDVTERRRAEADLREMNRQLRVLSASLQNVREEERSRISRELHDELGQQLTGLKLELSWLSSRMKVGRPVTPDRVDEMLHLLDGVIAAVRRISAELRPLILDDLGFGEAVSWLTGEFTRRSGIVVTIDLPAEADVTSDELATALFRIVQESLTNVNRHARATRVDIRLVADADRLVLTIKDNGVGLKVDGAEAGKRGIGLVSMRERATALGGEFATISSPATGTTVKVSIPRDPPDPDGEVA